MWNNLKAEFHNLLEDGDFVDEAETEILQTSFTYMRFLRMSPAPGKKLRLIDLIFFAVIACPFCIMCGTSYLLIQYLYYNYITLDDLLQCASVVCSGLNMYLTLGWFIYKNQDIANLAHNIGSFHLFRKPASFDRANRLANFLTSAMSIYTGLAVIFFTIVSYWQRTACLKENAEMKIERLCGLIVPAPFPMYFNEGIYFYIIFGMQTFNISVVCLAACIVLTFTCGLVIVINSRIQLCKEDMRAAFGSTNDYDRKRRLKECVRYHVYMINLARNLNDCMSTACFIQSSFMSAVIAMIAFQFLMKPELKTLAHGLGWILVLAILSYGGQMLIDNTIDIPMHIYKTDWFDYDVETQKIVSMIILRGNYYLYIDTIFFGPLALTTFGQVIENAYSLIAILYQKS